MKAELLTSLGKHADALESLQRQLKKLSERQVPNAGIKASVSAAASEWFDEIVPALERVSFDRDAIKKFSDAFSGLLKLKGSASRANAYLRTLAELIRAYKHELIHVIETKSFGSSSAFSIAPYVEGLAGDESEYLDEAQRCLTVKGVRACIVLGWCATISRMHQKIADVGFDKFNNASAAMTAKTTGRFKPFNKRFDVASVSELERMVFDTDLLWVLEYMQFIDSNQHERLRHCFTLRNNSAHPGQAPITGENLYSFYSDITHIVLKNPKFAVSTSSI